jgi:hypothetical protein
MKIINYCYHLSIVITLGPSQSDRINVLNMKTYKFTHALLFQGVTKRMKISRRVVGNDGSIRKEEKVLTINVKPGNSFCLFSILSSLLMKFLKICSVMRNNIFILVLNELVLS